MKKILRLSESDLIRLVKKVINEQNKFPIEKIKHIVDRINDVPKTTKYDSEEDYGIDEKIYKNFRRRYEIFELFLAENIYSVQTKEFPWLMEQNKYDFTTYLLIYSLLDFFYYTMNEEYEIEDFKRNGPQEGFLYFVREIYEDELGKIYEELKNY